MADLVIIGAGAAGLFCAIEAGKRGLRVVVIERNATPGRKIIISGGGRCNFTNRHVTPEHFVSANPHFCKSALAGYTSEDFVELVKKYKIQFYEKKLGQLFCRGRSHEILEMLLDECAQANVELVTDCRVDRVEQDKNFVVDTTKGRFVADSLVVATGGLSFPKLGATDFGHRIARQFGHKIKAVRPSLVPLRFSKGNYSDLSGLSIDATVASGGQSFRENILFTHKGLSGPAVLQISNYWRSPEDIFINLLPDQDIYSVLIASRNSKQILRNFMADYLPVRFVNKYLQRELSETSLNELSDVSIRRIGEMINSWQVKFSDTEGWHKAEVTLGGVDTDMILSKTMESRIVSGLYFIGEVLDVTGWLGGYNFQWAWSSGYACGSSIGE
jgi:predicted Rossmann fold flavoprotein